MHRIEARGRPRGVLCAFALLALLALLAPSPALGLDPPQDPALILQEDFEFIGTAYPSYLSIVKIPYGIPPSAAKWGTMTNQRKSGSRALWCAGSVPSAYPYYPVNTQTYATFSLPELADYYSSEVGYWWRQPSYGVADQRSFGVFWRYLPNTSDLTVRDRFGTRSTWAYRTLSLSDETFDVNLSRAAGEVTFEFYDLMEGYGQTPMVGEGAWIDLVSFTGYTYGPVNTLTATSAGAGIMVDWDAPYRSIGSVQPEDRDHGYRVWRAEGTVGPYTWTELTSTRPTETAFFDSGITPDEDYTYLVQAWDLDTGSGYGISQTATATASSTPMTLDKSVDTTAALSGSRVTYTYEVTNHTNQTLTDVSVDDDKLGHIGTLTLPPFSTDSLSADATLTVTTSNVATATGIDPLSLTEISDTDTVTVSVVAPAVAIDKSVDATAVVAGDAVTYTYTIINVGDVELVNLAITDDKLGSIDSGIALDPLESYEVTAAATLTETTTNDATVTGADAVLASPVTDTDSATVTVYDPSISIVKTASDYDVLPSTTVTYTYTVTNTGDLALTTVVVTDDVLGAVGSIPILAPAGIWTGQVAVVLDADVTNTGDVVATYGSPGADVYGTVQDSDTISVNVIAPALTVDKTVDLPFVLTGTDVVYTYTVTNTGDVPLTSVTCDDDLLGSVFSGVSLSPAASHTSTIGASISSSTTNTASAEGRWGPGVGETVTATDQAHVGVVHPGVSIEKSVDATTVVAGDSVTYTYTVTNTGDVGLVNLAITDDKLGSIASGIALAPQGTYEVTAGTTLTETTANDATVTGADAILATPVTDTDAVTVTVFDPAITVAVSVDEPVVLSGTGVTYTYSVTNTGDATLRNVVIDDDELGVIDTVTMLAPDQNVVRQAGATIDVDTTNAVTVTGTFGVQGTAFYGQRADTDGVSVDVVAPALRVTAQADAASVPPGTSVTFTYTIENPGDVRIADITLVDSLGGSWSPLAVAAGGSIVRSRSYTISSAVNNVVTASGIDELLGTTASDSDSVSVAVAADEVERISGTSRLATAIQMSRKAFPSGGADTVVIATAYGFADALSASALAGAVDGPLLLVDPGALPGDVRSEIIRLGARDAFVIGGPGVVGPAVVSAIDAISGMRTPVRLGGSNRYDTAELVAREVRAVTGTSPAKVFVATGADFPDALAASSIAAAGRWPILLTQKDSIPSDTRSALSALSPGEIVVCGGTGVVSSGVQSQLAAYGPVIRKGGTSRYNTARVLVEWGEGALGITAPGGLYAATGTNYPDALAGGPLGGGVGGAQWRPLVLTEPGSLSADVRTYMRATPSLGYAGVLGGTGAVSDAVKNQLYQELVR